MWRRKVGEPDSERGRGVKDKADDLVVDTTKNENFEHSPRDRVPEVRQMLIQGDQSWTGWAASGGANVTWDVQRHVCADMRREVASQLAAKASE